MFKTVDELRKEMMKAKVSDKFKASMLSMMLTETLNIAKADKNREATEQDITAAIKKMTKMAEQSLTAGVKGAQEEVEFLKQFAPKMISREDTEQIVNELINVHGKNVGVIMKEVKTSYGNTIDMKLVSKLIKNV